MLKSVKNKILQEVALWSDEKLKKEYYKTVYVCLGSRCERMYELGYDIQDIREQEQIERENEEYNDLLAYICENRGIKLWE